MSASTDYSEFISAAIVKMREEADLKVDDPIADGQIHRCATYDKPRRINGAYIIHEDGFPCAWFFNWGTNVEGTFCAIPKSQMNKAQRSKYKERLAQIKAKANEDRERRHKEAAKVAVAEWEKAGPPDRNHAYLKEKTICSFGLRQNKRGNLLVPIMDIHGNIQSLQEILPSRMKSGGNKLFLTGGKIQDGFFHIQENEDYTPDRPCEYVIICEGYATGASIALITGYKVLIAFTAYNLLNVAKIAMQLFPEYERVIAADYDLPNQTHNEPGGTGVALARKAAQITRSHLAICPSKNGEKVDFNDLCQNTEGRQRAFEAIYYALDAKPEKPLPTIKFKKSNLPETVAALENALQGKVYQNAGRLVSVIRLPEEQFNGNRKAKLGNALLNQLDANALLNLAAKVAQWTQYDARLEEDVPTTPPNIVINALLGNKGNWSFPPIFGVTSCPVLRGDGTIIRKPGYDKRTGLYCDFDINDYDFSDIPYNPTKEQAHKALNFLLDALDEFEFEMDFEENKSESGNVIEAAHFTSRSVALAAILTSVSRPAYQDAPVFAVAAPVAGTGKSELCKFVGIVATGSMPATFVYTDDETEMKKALFAFFGNGTQVLIIDNAVGLINNPVLNQATQATGKMTDRVLGKNTDMITVSSSKTLMLINGNNLCLCSDMTRRALYCRLNANSEKPYERNFKRVLSTWAMENRTRIISAALTILSAYVNAGYPGHDKLIPMRGYEAWSKFVRGALVWLEQDDPKRSQVFIEDNDPIRMGKERIFTTWFDFYGERLITAKILCRVEIIKGINPNAEKQTELSDALNDGISHSGELSPWRVGQWLLKYQDGVIETKHDGETKKLQLQRGKKDRTGASQWQLKQL